MFRMVFLRTTVGRLLKNLHALRRIGFAANRLLLEIEQISHDCALGEDALQDLQRARDVDGQRAPALRFADPRVQALMHALLLFVFVAQGFTNKQLRQAMAPLLGQAVDDISPGRMSYELRRLRLHGLIERVPKTQRYRLTSQGLATALFYSRVYSCIPRSGLSIVTPITPPTEPPSALRRCFDAAQQAVNDWCAEAKIAA
jgi:hypothetical protein